MARIASGCWLRLELALAGALAATLGAAHAQDQQLVPGPGSALASEKCQICHEIGHVTRSRLSREGWIDMVKLMRERGAPLTDAEAETIVAYLATYYGTAPAPAPAPDKPAAQK
jgi:mono/diheme cytochrome c family protein